MSMKLVISSGHSIYCQGMSSPYLNEVEQATRVVDRVGELLKGAGVDCITYHDTISDDSSENLNRICNFHNAQSPHDYDISVHFNATPGAFGTECWYYTQEALAAKVSAAMAKAGGFKDRGAKYSGSLFVLTNFREPAILLEVCFGDSKSDTDLYYARFEEICVAIAESISGVTIGEQPPPVEGERPPAVRPDNPFEVPLESRTMVGKGDTGVDVEDLQLMLNWELRPSPNLDTDGDFGSLTDSATREYQRTRGLAADGICGENTWGALYSNLGPIPPPPHALTTEEIKDICLIADESVISNYSWRDRGIAPDGYMRGMACSFAQSYRKLKQGHPAVMVMASARMNSDKDALNIYKMSYNSLGMSNEQDGIATLRHLFALMLGSGMRESNGRHCEGRDQSAENTSSDTAEAGLFQTSYNAHGASDPEFSNLMAEYSEPANAQTCYLAQFDDGVSCTNSEWDCYGSGSGYAFQSLCKACPAFAVETHALTLRNLANHYGPIIRKEVELKSDSDRLFQSVQRYIDDTDAPAKVAKKKPKKGRRIA
jgi:hypothetical protein